MKVLLCLLLAVYVAKSTANDNHKTFDEATTKFALGMYEQIAKASDASKNIIFSPLSIFTAFGMLKAGAKGKTAEEMDKVMAWNDLISEKDSSGGHSGLKRLLKRVFDPLTGNNTISVANKLWMQSGFCKSDCKNYVKTLEKNYKAALEELNFVTKPEASRQAINKWVEEQTNNKIKDLMPGGSISPLTRFVLTNAIYFKSKWKNPFDKRDTRDFGFDAVGKNGVTNKQVPTMYQNGRFFTSGFIPTARYQLLEMPYAGDSLSMVIILPRDMTEMRNLEKTQSSVKKFNQMLQELYEFPETQLDVYLPKFKVSSDLNLKDYLSKMGMKSVFSPTKADLSGITGYRGMYVSAAVHKAYANVDEEGTEAAAATGINIALASLPFQFQVNKPFMFVIRHRKTGTILFMGRVVDPTVE